MLNKRTTGIEPKDEFNTASGDAENAGIDAASEHRSREERRAHSAMSDTPGIMKKVFAILMIVIYLGMGALVFGGFFDVLFGEYTAAKYSLGLLFILYGFWRAYRYIKVR